eukprot:7131707-Pyramimonas_sp.AAC.1
MQEARVYSHDGPQRAWQCQGVQGDTTGTDKELRLARTGVNASNRLNRRTAVSRVRLKVSDGIGCRSH